MFVNVSPSANLCDETLHVLKFGALAQELVIQPTDRDSSMADCSISLFAPPIRPSRFQQYVRKSISILSASARASVLEPSFQAIGEDDESLDRILSLETELARIKSDWEDNEQKVLNRTVVFIIFLFYFFLNSFYDGFRIWLQVFFNRKSVRKYSIFLRA